MTIRFHRALLSVFLAALTVSGFAARGVGQARDDVGAEPPQVRPVLVWLTAVKNGDQEGLKTAFSDPMQQQFDREGWEAVLRTYRQIFAKEFGDYRLGEFSFEFKGDERRGTVRIAFKGRTLPGLRVVNEKNEWKIDER